MLGNLPESRRRRERRLAGTLTSALAHAVVILAIVGTANAGPGPRADEIVDVIDLPPLPPEEPPFRRRATGSGSTTGSTAGGPVLRVPDRIDIEIPPVDPDAPVLEDPGRKGFERGGGPATAGVPGPGESIGDAILTLATVEKPVLQLPTPAAIRYPTMLRDAGIEGDVNARFVVDTAGRVEKGSLVVLHSSNELFTASVRAALPAMRFVPAEAGGRKVRQLVEQRFVFELQR